MVNHKLKKYESISPGPAAKYNTLDSYNKSINGSVSFSMGSKFEQGSGMVNLAMKDFPGPGGYSPEVKYKREGSTKFGKDERKSLVDLKQALSVPAPNGYTPRSESIQKTSPRCKFGNQT